MFLINKAKKKHMLLNNIKFSSFFAKKNKKISTHILTSAKHNIIMYLALWK